jgi:hypothetical protein
MNKGKITFKYLLFCFVTLALSYTLHAIILNEGFSNKLLLEAYSFNFILFGVITIIFFILGKTHKDHLGFIYLLAMFSKLLIMYFVFKTKFKMGDNLVTKTEILSVLVPYCICLIYSIKYLSNRLNTED